MEDKLFDTPNKRRKAIEDLNALLAHPGWQLFTKMLDTNIDKAENEILSDEDGEREDELKEARRLRRLCLWAKHLPNEVLTTLTNSEQTPEVNLDPYE